LSPGSATADSPGQSSGAPAGGPGGPGASGTTSGASTGMSSGSNPSGGAGGAREDWRRPDDASSKAWQDALIAAAFFGGEPASSIRTDGTGSEFGAPGGGCEDCEGNRWWQAGYLLGTVAKVGPLGAGASRLLAGRGGTTALKAADLGLSGNGIAKLVGTVTDAGGTRIINVGYIEAVSKGALAGELRGALPNILNAARAEGVQTLQITGTFANPGLQQFAARQAAQHGGTFSSAGGVEALTFILR
jgi:hypothetical protein